MYVTCDHVVWAGGAGAVDKRSTLYKVCDKLSLMGWAAGSALMAAGHVPALIAYTRALRDPLASDNKRDDDADEWELREELEEKTVAAALDVASGLTQALFALSLLGAPVWLCCYAHARGARNVFVGGVVPLFYVAAVVGAETRVVVGSSPRATRARAPR